MPAPVKEITKSAREKRLQARKEKAKRYWEARAQARVRATDKDSAKVQSEVHQAYQAAATDIGTSLKAFYQRFATDAGITLAEARQLLKPSELNDYKRELARKRAAVQALIKEHPDNRRLKRYDTEFENLPKIKRLTREQMLQKELEHAVFKLGATQEKSLQDGLKAKYNSALTRTDADLSKLSVDTHIAVPTPTNTERAVREKWLGQDFSERIWTDKGKLVEELRSILSQGFIQNDGIDAMSRQLVQRMNVSMSNARRLIRTEFNHIANQGSLASYKERKVKQYRFLAAIDSRTSEICESLHNQVFNVEDAAVGVNFPPMHPYCRSTTVAVFDDEDDERYNFNHIELTKEELRELGLDTEDKPPAPTLTEREVRAAEREMQSPEVETRVLKRIEQRAERLIDTAHGEADAIHTAQGRVDYEARWQDAWLKRSHNALTVRIEEERLIDWKESIKEREQGVIALEERMAEIAAEWQPTAPPPPEPLSIDTLDESADKGDAQRLEPFPKEERKVQALPDAAPPVVVKAKRFVDWLRAAVDKVKAGFNRIVERLREFVERLMPQPTYAMAGGVPLGGVQVNMMAGQGSGGSRQGSMPMKDARTITDRLAKDWAAKLKDNKALAEKHTGILKDLKAMHGEARLADVIAVGQMPGRHTKAGEWREGRKFFLNKEGLVHILYRHGFDFDPNIKVDDVRSETGQYVVSDILTALEKGRIIGYQKDRKSKKDADRRPIYEFTLHNGKRMRLAISLDHHGRIRGANTK